MSKPWSIAIDGPAGAGKSTVARLLARRLGYLYVDSGATYRAVALLCVRSGVRPDDSDSVAALARGARIAFDPDPNGGDQRTMLDDEDVTDAIRSPEIATIASVISAIPGVRAALVAMQQSMGRQGGVVMEGRDIGTVVLPNADVKVFLTASPEKRAERRLLDIQSRGRTSATIEQVRSDQDDRDQRDTTRQVSPLAPAPDAILLDSDGLSPEEVTEQILDIVDRWQMEA